MEKQQYKDFYMTQAEVAAHLGLNRGEVGHIEKQALKKVKEELKRRGIDAKLFFKD